MSPVELETLVAERAIRTAIDQTLETGRHAMSDALQRIEEAHNQLVSDLTARAAELATLVAKRVIARELRIQRDIVVDLVREALDVLNSRDRVRVHLGSEFAVMQDDLVAHYSAAGTLVDVVVDDSLPAYGCLVETEVGSVDESIESRLAALLDAVNGNEGD
jgi:flagellar assembly protein FliH